MMQNAIMKTVGIVLAGGKSSRMGTDKANLTIGNRTLLTHAADGLSSVLGCATSQIFVSGNRDGFLCIPDVGESSGPLSGLWSISEYFRLIPESHRPLHALIVPVDMPLLREQELRKLAESPVDFEMVHFEGHELPLRLKLCSQISGKIELELKSSRSIKGLRARLQSFSLKTDTESREHFSNLNTFSDYQGILP